RAEVRPVHVGVGHADDAVVAELLDVEVLRTDAGPERRDHRPDFVAADHLVEPRTLDVQNLPFDRQDRLEAAVAPLLGRTTCRLALDDVQLALRRIPFLAVGELAAQAAAVARAPAVVESARAAVRRGR